MARATIAAWTMAVSLAAATAATAAALHEGVWIGGVRTSADPVFARLVLGGSGQDAAGRIDFPVRQEWSILLQRVSVKGTAVAFEVPGATGNIRFEGQVTGDRLAGLIRQGAGSAPFEFVRASLINDQGFDEMVGDYEFGPGEVVLLYASPSGPAYVDYRSGRTGALYRLSDGRFVAGPSVSSAYPIEIEVVFERDAAGHGVAVQWTSGGRRGRAVRRQFYRTEPAEYWNGDVKIAGSLLRPAAPGPHPAVVLVPGTGTTTRAVMMPIADVLARNGIAALVSDRRGSGESTGSQARTAFEVLADDVVAGVHWLQAQPGINDRQVGVEGASLGGWIAPLAASRSSDVAFVIVEAAPATTPAEHERQRVVRQMRADGQSREAIALASLFMDKKFEVGRTGKGWDTLQDMMKRAERGGWLHYVNPPASLENLRWNWEHVLSYDPRPALQSLTCPVLALYAEKDTIVAPDVHLARMREALDRSSSRDATVKQLAGANHYFLSASTGGPGENTSLRGFVDGYFEARLTWLRSHVDTVSTDATAVAALAGSFR